MQTHIRSFILSLASLTVTSLTVMMPAQAASLTWTLQNAVFEDGGTLTGSFDYDAEANTYSNVNIAVSSGSILDNFVYQTSSRCTQTSTTTCIADFWGQTPGEVLVDVLDQSYKSGIKGWLFLSFAQALTNAGGVVPLDNSGEQWIRTEGGDTHRSGMRTVVAGEVVTQPASAAVPEPTTMAGLALAGSGLATLRRRKATITNSQPADEPSS
jgi:hypothetical protein